MATWNGVKVHSSPTMYGTGSSSVYRSGSTIHVDVTARLYFTKYYNREFGYHYACQILWNGNVKDWFYIKDNNTPYKNQNYDSGNVSHSCSWDDNSSGTVTIRYYCCGSGDGLYPHECKVGSPYYDVGSDGVSNYNPETDATNVSTGCVFSTNNSGRQDRVTRTDYLHNEIWFDWWGQSSGYPDSKWGIDYYNVDCNTENNADKAHSDGYSRLQHYTQNTHLSCYEIAKGYKMKPGDILYCWVNTHVKGDFWLGRSYLGALKMTKRGLIYYKDGSGGQHECTTSHEKDTSGNNRNGRYIYVKDTSGNQRIIDTYTDLY